MKAIVIGATGATGKSLLPLLAASSEVESIDCFDCRHPDFAHQKLNSHQIDFSHPDDWCEEVQGDVLFACLGTTLKAAGSKEAQWAIDYEASQSSQTKRHQCFGFDFRFRCKFCFASVLSKDERRIGAGNYRFELSVPHHFLSAIADSSE